MPKSILPVVTDMVQIDKFDKTGSFDVSLVQNKLDDILACVRESETVLTIVEKRKILRDLLSGLFEELKRPFENDPFKLKFANNLIDQVLEYPNNVDIDALVNKFLAANRDKIAADENYVLSTGPHMRAQFMVVQMAELVQMVGKMLNAKDKSSDKYSPLLNAFKRSRMIAAKAFNNPKIALVNALSAAIENIESLKKDQAEFRNPSDSGPSRSSRSSTLSS